MAGSPGRVSRLSCPQRSSDSSSFKQWKLTRASPLPRQAPLRLPRHTRIRHTNNMVAEVVSDFAESPTGSARLRRHRSVGGTSAALPARAATGELHELSGDRHDGTAPYRDRHGRADIATRRGLPQVYPLQLHRRHDHCRSSPTAGRPHRRGRADPFRHLRA